MNHQGPKSMWMNCNIRFNKTINQAHTKRACRIFDTLWKNNPANIMDIKEDKIQIKGKENILTKTVENFPNLRKEM